MSCCKKYIERYSYIKNEPKNVVSIKLQPIPELSSFETYNYALYKPSRREEQPSKSDEKKWKGVV